MKSIVYIFCAAIIASSCNTQQSDVTENVEPGLYVVSITSTKLDSTQLANLNGLTSNKDEIKKISTTRFEITLKELSNGSGFLAERNITKPSSETLSSTTEYICDHCGGKMTFATTNKFLDFMSERGYFVTNQTKNGQGFDYTFGKI